MARSEFETLRDRIISGLAQARQKGVKLGRPRGTTLSRQLFLQKHDDILRQLQAGISVRKAAKLTGKGASTVQRVKLAMATQALRHKHSHPAHEPVAQPPKENKSDDFVWM
jgi:DNA invertase Pin-like site-specific DNA recombinase